MTESSRPFFLNWNTMTEEQWAEFYRYLLDTGVISESETQPLLVSPNANPYAVDISVGSAYVRGHIYENDSIKTLQVNPNTSDAGTRADLVVLTCKWGLDPGIIAEILEGNPGDTWPTDDPHGQGLPMPKVPVQTDGVKWQVPLAQVNVTKNMGRVFQPMETMYSSLTYPDMQDWRSFVNSGNAQSVTCLVASDGASSNIRGNATYNTPYGTLNADRTINEAITAVNDLGGGTVTLSEGVFKTSSSIELLDNVNLGGQGNRTVLEYQVAAAHSNNNPVINIEARSNTQVTSLSIDGGGPVPANPPISYDGFDGIVVTDGKYNTIKDLQVSNCYDSGISLTTTDLTGAIAYGNVVRDCFINSNASNGISCQHNSSIIKGNNIVGNGARGVDLSSATGAHGASNNLISVNMIRQNQWDGIGLYCSGTASAVSGNMIQGNTLQWNGARTTNAACNIYCGDDTSAGQQNEYNNILNNECISSGTIKVKYGIEFNTVNNCVATGNVIIGYGTNAILVSGGSGNIPATLLGVGHDAYANVCTMN